MSENTTIERPASNATKAVWVEYAVAMGTDREEAETATKAEIMEKYPVAPEGDGNDSSRMRTAPPDTSHITADAIKAAKLGTASLLAAGAPQRERKPEQKLMDEVAERAYARWIEADRPSAWAKLPVVTYFLDDEDVAAYRYLIRRACDVTKPIGSMGVRARFGREFTLSEEMAREIGQPDDAGKTVLMWAAVDKRLINSSSDTSVQRNGDEG